MDEPDDIPDQIAGLLSPGERSNVIDRNGWAIGIVETYKNGEVKHRHEDAIIELFNGEGGARQFGGVRYMVVDDSGELEESYAYATPESVPDDKGDYATVVEYTDPEDPEYGEQIRG